MIRGEPTWTAVFEQAGELQGQVGAEAVALDQVDEDLADRDARGSGQERAHPVHEVTQGVRWRDGVVRLPARQDLIPAGDHLAMDRLVFPLQRIVVVLEEHSEPGYVPRRVSCHSGAGTDG